MQREKRELERKGKKREKEEVGMKGKPEPP